MLLKQLRASKQKCANLSIELKNQLGLVKTTVVNETRAENEIYKLELLRLRNLLEKELNSKVSNDKESPIKFDN